MKKTMKNTLSSSIDGIVQEDKNSRSIFSFKLMAKSFKCLKITNNTVILEDK